MPAITIADLNKAKQDVDHIAELSTSQALTATDRLGNTKDTLAGAIYKISAFNDRGPWVTARSYAIKDLVSNGGTWYVCVAPHVSGATFSGDVATKWRVYQGLTAADLAATLANPAQSAGLGFTPVGTISATNVQDAVAEILSDYQSGAGASQIGFKHTGVSAGVRELQTKIRELCISVNDYDVAGLGVDAAVSAALNAAILTGLPLYFPPGIYNFQSSSTTVWDLTSVTGKGLTVYGAGPGWTTLNFPNITSTVAFQIKATADWYDFSMEDMKITGVTSGALFCIGNNDFADPLNVGNFKNLIVLNSSSNSAAVAWRLNYVVNSNFIGCRANCFANGAGTNIGTSLECRQVEFCTFTNGSYGNGEYGVRFKDGVNFGNVFIGTDHENVNHCVSTDSNSSGNNTFIGGQFSLWEVSAFKTTGSLSTNSITVINGNYSNGVSAAPIVDASNNGKIRLIDGRGVTTPSIPPSTVATSNTTGKRVLVTFWGGAISQASVDGFGIGIPHGSVALEHGQSIALSYTSSPTWTWRALE